MRLFRFFLLYLCLAFSSPLFAGDQASTVNINTADATTLATILKGVGPSKAEAIITYRKSFGLFQAVEELAEVKGIGKSLLNKNRELIVLK